MALAVVQLERRIDLAAAFDGLLVEVVGAALGAVEARLEAVADVEEQIDGADGVGAGGDVLAVACRLKVHHGCSGGKDTPVDGIGEGLPLRKAEAGARRREAEEPAGRAATAARARAQRIAAVTVVRVFTGGHGSLLNLTTEWTAASKLLIAAHVQVRPVAGRRKSRLR